MNCKMKPYSTKSNICVFFLLIFLIGCTQNTSTKRHTKESRVATLPYYEDPSFTPKWLTPDSDSLKNFHKIPPFSLTNQEGKTITHKRFKDKTYTTDFFFTTCPGICPKMTDNMKVLQDAFIEENEVLLLSHSVTPDVDSVSTLRNYAIDKGVLSSKWHLVTGDRKEIYNLGRTAYFVEEYFGVKKTKDDFLHTENFVLIDKNKHIRGIYNSLNKGTINQLIANIKTLQKE